MPDIHRYSHHYGLFALHNTNNFGFRAHIASGEVVHTIGLLLELLWVAYGSGSIHVVRTTVKYFL